jgi:hypothetical protein
MAHLTNWVGIDDHADKLTIALYVGSQKQPTKEWEVAPPRQACGNSCGGSKSSSDGCTASTRLVRAGMSCIGCL